MSLISLFSVWASVEGISSQNTALHIYGVKRGFTICEVGLHIALFSLFCNFASFEPRHLVSYKEGGVRLVTQVGTTGTMSLRERAATLSYIWWEERLPIWEVGLPKSLFFTFFFNWCESWGG